jgi:hypothetical protein
MVHGLLTDTRHEFIIDAPARPEPPADASANANGELRSAKSDGPAGAFAEDDACAVLRRLVSCPLNPAWDTAG